MTLLEVEHIQVAFGGHHALTDVDLAVASGQVTGLIGPNGAGKTTLFNVISGLQPPTRGRVRFDGADITDEAPYRRARIGLARTFQRLEVFGSLTVRENLLVGAETRRSWGHDDSDPTDDVERILRRVGVADVADERADALPTGMARLVEIGRALATRPRALLLDEPASGLDDTESEALVDLLRALGSEGLAVLLVEHDVGLVMQVCEQINVLDFGAILARGTPAEIQTNQAVLDAYLGASPVATPIDEGIGV